jgi:hypothetical protein
MAVAGLALPPRNLSEVLERISKIRIAIVDAQPYLNWG